MNPLFNFFALFQKLIAKNVKIENLDFQKVKEIVFLDCAYKKEKVKCVCIIYDKTTNKIEKVDELIEDVYFPYVPTFLFLREAPYMIKLIERNPADLYVIDGHGLAHPRKAGIATVIGVLLDIPTIGIAKKYLYGDLVNNKILVDNAEVGIKFKNYYISIGNKVDTKTLEDFLKFFNYEYPWPLKEADKISKDFSNLSARKL